MNKLVSSIGRLQEFVSAFKGNPQEMANTMMQSGRFSPQQIEKAKEMATQIEALINSLNRGV